MIMMMTPSGYHSQFIQQMFLKSKKTRRVTFDLLLGQSLGLLLCFRHCGDTEKLELNVVFKGGLVEGTSLW